MAVAATKRYNTQIKHQVFFATQKPLVVARNKRLLLDDMFSILINRLLIQAWYYKRFPLQQKLLFSLGKL